MNFKRNIRFGMAGLSLVELMVALAIGMALLGGMYQVFFGSTAGYLKNEQFARLQENARFAMEVLGRDLRVAGYSGCSNQTGTIVNTLNDTSYLFNFNVGIQGFDYVGPNAPSGLDALDFSPNLDASIPLTDMVEGSDVLTIRRIGRGDPVLLDSDMPNSSADPSVPTGTSSDSIDADDIVMISDCNASAVFQVTSYNSGTGIVGHDSGGTPTFGDSDYPGNFTKNLGQVFPIGSEITRLSTITYFVRNNPAGVPSLYSSAYSSTNELVQGVERMQVRFGVDTDGDRQVDAYVSAGAVGTWNQVVAVRVGLLMQGDINNKFPVDTKQYDLDGDGVNDYDPPDEQRMRRVFKATFALRNRVA